MIKTEERPIVYLDVDDVLLHWEGGARKAAPHAREFLRWLRQHFEVRWMTSWCPGGALCEERLRELSRFLGIPPGELAEIRNPKAFPEFPHDRPSKHFAVDYEETRPWVWVEDQKLHEHNLEELRRRGVFERYIECNTSDQRDDLLRVQSLLAERFGVPVVPLEG